MNIMWWNTINIINNSTINTSKQGKECVLELLNHIIVLLIITWYYILIISNNNNKNNNKDY